MGMPTKTQIEAQTDRMAAALLDNLTGFRNETGSGSVGSLAALVDGVGDADYEAAMLAASLVFDRQSLPENLRDALPYILNRPGYAAWVRAWEGHLLSAAGGSQSNIRAYLDGLGAQVHPLFAELVRAVKNEAVFTPASGPVQCVYAPNYATVSPSRVYTGADGSLTDDTTDAGDAGTADVDLFASDDDCLYIGYDSRFSRVIVGLSTAASATITPTFQYWNGTAWATLSVTDNTTGFTLNDVISFTAPADWARCSADAGGTAFADLTPRYYIRIARTANSLVTAPVATCIQLCALPTLNAAGAHLGVDQPPLALLIIRGSTTVVVDAALGGSGATAHALAHARWRPQPIRLRALTAGAGTSELTLTYVDQDGNAGTQAQSALSSPAALATISITLANGNTGVQSITSCTVASGSRAVFAIETVPLRTPTR